MSGVAASPCEGDLASSTELSSGTGVEQHATCSAAVSAYAKGREEFFEVLKAGSARRSPVCSVAELEKMVTSSSSPFFQVFQLPAHKKFGHVSQPPLRQLDAHRHSTGHQPFAGFGSNARVSPHISSPCLSCDRHGHTGIDNQSRPFSQGTGFGLPRPRRSLQQQA